MSAAVTSDSSSPVQSLLAALQLGASLHPRLPSPPAAPVCPGVYRHYKTRELYLVLSVVRHTESGELMVLYKNLYLHDGNPDMLHNVRPLSMFVEEVLDEQGQMVPRFQLVPESTVPSHREAGFAERACTTIAQQLAATNDAASPNPDAAVSTAVAPAEAPAAPPAPVAAPTAPATSAAASTPTYCSNPSCPNPAAPACSRCARCQSGVSYCSRACQGADWKSAHQARCIEPNKLRVAAVKALIAEKEEQGYETALRSLARMQSDPSISSQLAPSELLLARELEASLRREIRSPKFDRVSMYGRHARSLFRGEGDMVTTWHSTFMHALNSMPARCRPAARPSFTAENPMVIYWLGARDDREGGADFRALETALDTHAVLYLIGPPVTEEQTRRGLSGLSSAQESVYERLRVRRVVGMYPACAPEELSAQQPHVVACFNAGLDANFASWVPALQHLALMQPVAPAVITTGYSTDDSSLQDEIILRTLGLQVVLPTRFSPHGFALMPPHVSNQHITVSQGTARDLTAEEKAALPFSAAKIEEVAQRLRERGFDVKMS